MQNAQTTDYRIRNIYKPTSVDEVGFVIYNSLKKEVAQNTMKLDENILQIFNKDWALVTAGDEKHFNTMTIGWGGLGTLWSKPVATVYVKPIRYTHEFLEKNDYFTVSFFDGQHKKALGVLGTKSGKDCDKVKESGLTPRFLQHGVTFCEAYTTLVCKKIYQQELDMSAIPQDAIDRYYQSEAPHTMYIGEVVDVIYSEGVERNRRVTKNCSAHDVDRGGNAIL